MLRKLREARSRHLTVFIDGTPVTARPGDSVAAVMLAMGHDRCRTVRAERKPHCAMDVCFDCHVVADGLGNRRGCLVEVRDGMRVETREGRPHPG